MLPAVRRPMMRVPGYGGVYDGYVVAQLGLEHAVEVLTATECDEAVAVGKFAKDADFIAVLVLSTSRHADRSDKTTSCECGGEL